MGMIAFLGEAPGRLSSRGFGMFKRVGGFDPHPLVKKKYLQNPVGKQKNGQKPMV